MIDDDVILLPTFRTNFYFSLEVRKSGFLCDINLQFHRRPQGHLHFQNGGGLGKRLLQSNTNFHFNPRPGRPGKNGMNGHLKMLGNQISRGFDMRDLSIISRKKTIICERKICY